MDIALEQRLNEALEQAAALTGGERVDVSRLDPAQRIMLVALMHECQKIHDYADSAPERVAQHFAEQFIPRRSIAAMPAIALLSVKVKERAGSTVVVGPDITFKTKTDIKLQPTLPALNFTPVFSTLLLQHSDVITLNKRCLRHGGGTSNITMNRANVLYVGIRTEAEPDSLVGLSLLLSGTEGTTPVRITTGPDNRPLGFATMDRMEDITMLAPFDAQQSSGRFFAFVESWKEQLLDMTGGQLLYITDDPDGCDLRDLYKRRAYPPAFEQWLEEDIRNTLPPDTLWLRLEFPEGYEVQDWCRVELNVLPVTNVDVHHVTLTPSTPIAKLQKQDGDYFLDVLEQSVEANRQGFPANNEEFVVRDFDAACYHNGDLYRDVRTLYNHFVDDYYAFIDYNGIKDGDTIRTLRATINAIGKAARQTPPRYLYDSGTYAMKNIATEDSVSTGSTSVRVNFITTRGSEGNLLPAGVTLECRRAVAVERDAEVIVGGMGGRDKATADQHYELLRYHTLTADRLFTRMDIDAFLRKEIMAFFGREEFRRITVKVNVEGTEGERGLRRGLFVDIAFKDTKNYARATALSLATRLKQRIERKACLTMPVTVTLTDLEKDKNQS